MTRIKNKNTSQIGKVCFMKLEKKGGGDWGKYEYYETDKTRGVRKSEQNG